MFELIGLYFLQVEKYVLDLCRPSCPEWVILCALLHEKKVHCQLDDGLYI